MSNDTRFTKLEMKLENIDLQVKRIVSQIESETGTMARAHTNINDKLNQILGTLYGNGKPGLLTDVALLKDHKNSRQAQIKLIWGSVVALFISHVWKILFP
jgi:hypothetical protein